jgi:pimeloyl-ACP methyl ester carboxylesterase
MKPCEIRLVAVAMLVIAAAGAGRMMAQAALPEPLSIARQGYVFAGGKYSTVGDRQVLSGHLYAEFQIPTSQTRRWPIVMIHGGGQTGTNFTGTPDGREGWAQFFLRQGYVVYVVDQPGRGRAAYEADLYGPATRLNLDNLQRRFAAPERYNLWPQARLHTQWPGQPERGDPTFDQFYASQVPSIQDFTLQQVLNRDAILALLDKIGPAIILTHSQSGGFGWPVADARPDLVKAIVAVEPNGPPFFDIENVPAPEWFRDAAMPVRSWGPNAVPLAYSPPPEKASDLAIVREDKPDAPDLVRCWMQKSPARQLPNLAKLPILILTAQASYHAPYDHCTVKYLLQAGVRSTFIKLADAGITGNGHMMMLEKNNLEIGALISDWLAKSLPGTEVAVLSAGAVEPGVRAAAAAFEKQSGHAVKLVFNTTPQIRARMDSGERWDVVVVSPALLDELADGGKVEKARASVGRVGMGVAVREGAAAPDISNADALKRSVLAADSIVFNRASTGLYFEGLLKKMGIYDQIESRTTRYEDGAAVWAHIEKGKGREIGFGAITDILAHRSLGVRFVGPLPAEVQNYTAYAAAPMAASPNAEASGAFVQFLASPTGRALFVAAGLE